MSRANPARMPAEAGPGDLAADCAAALRAYAPAEPTQEALRARFLDHLGTHADGWSRACPGAHLTASALVCAPDASRVLLVRHRKLGRWLQTGGHLEPADPGLAAAALREASEESGLPGLRLRPGVLHLDAHEVPCGPVRPCFHLDVRYLVLADPAAAPAASDESDEVRWFAAGELPTDEPSVTVLVDLARALLR